MAIRWIIVSGLVLPAHAGVILISSSVPIQQEKALENSTQEPLVNDAGEFHRTSDYSGDLPPRTASQPAEDNPQPDFPAIAQLQFTTNGVEVSTRKSGYHPIEAKELRRMNRFAPTLQATAQWYLRELADSKISYVFADETGNKEVVQMNFQKKNFAHLAGISPVGRTMEEALEDFAYGRGVLPACAGGDLSCNYLS